MPDEWKILGDPDLDNGFIMPGYAVVDSSPLSEPEFSEYLAAHEADIRVVTNESRDNVVLGVIVVKKGQKVFLPRSPRLSSAEVAHAIADLVKSKALDVVNGEVIITSAGIRQRVRQLGEILNIGETRGVAGEERAYTVPRKFSTSRLLTLASKDDGPGKIRWRDNLDKNAMGVFPDAIDSIPENARKIVFFPGLGGEIEQWLKFGFREEDFVFVEADAVIAHALAEKYPKAYIVRQKFQQKTSSWLKKLRHHLGEDKISLISIDPENSLNKSFMSALEVFLRSAPIADRAFFAVNFSSGREGKAQIDFLRTVATLTDEGDMHSLRASAVENCVSTAAQNIMRTKGSRFNVEVLSSGNYQGNRNTRMHFSMNQLTRKL